MFHDFFEKGTFDIIFFPQIFCQMMKIRQKKHWGKGCNFAWQCKSKKKACPACTTLPFTGGSKKMETDENIITWLGNLNEK
jgi:hypothetical protein